MRTTICGAIAIVAVTGACSSTDASLEARLLELERENLRLQQAASEVFRRPSGEGTGVEIPLGSLDEIAEASGGLEGYLRDVMASVQTGQREREQRTATAGTQMLPATTSPSNAYILRNTQWGFGTENDAQWATIQFGETLMSITTSEQPMRTSIVDYGGAHAACLGQPLCVLSLQPDGALSVQHFVLDGTDLYPVQCFDYVREGSGVLPTDDVLLLNSGMVVASRSGGIACLRHISVQAFHRIGGAVEPRE